MTNFYSIISDFDEVKRDYPLPSSHDMLKMSTIGRNACVQTFAKVVDSFVDRCLWQVTIK